MLGPYRGQPPADTEALVDLMVRLSQFAADHGDAIAEIDLNPVIVHPRGEGVFGRGRADRQTRVPSRHERRGAAE